ncbi:MAG: hypothetical protein MR821_03420, partial [Clostridiales bacterium]|nr:hypothetical protein [Clostridiales bacterium]
FPYCSKEKAVSEQDAKHPTIETGADSAKLDFSRKIVLHHLVGDAIGIMPVYSVNVPGSPVPFHASYDPYITFFSPENRSRGRCRAKSLHRPLFSV